MKYHNVNNFLLVNQLKKFLFLLFSLCIIYIYCENNDGNVIFQFPEFDYKETSKNVSY